jgi:acyl-CoA thioester hydrolase
MDALAHVNNLAYLRWFEETRIAYARKVWGMIDGLGVILAHQRCDYLAPVTHPDNVEVRLSCTKLGRSSVTLSFIIRSDNLELDVARGEGVMVAFDYSTKTTVAIPDGLRERIIAFEEGYDAAAV